MLKQIIPATGWYALYEGSEKDTSYHLPVMCFGLNEDDTIKGYVDEGPEGIMEASKIGLSFICFVHESEMEDEEKEDL